MVLSFSDANAIIFGCGKILLVSTIPTQCVSKAAKIISDLSPEVMINLFLFLNFSSRC